MTPEIPTIAASALAGLMGSLHCFGMCGPLACTATAKASGNTSRWATSTVWQIARLGSYGLLGAVLGGVGEGAAGLFSLTTSPALPWALAALLVASATGLLDKLPALPLFERFGSKLVPLCANSAPLTRAGALGALVALLPCGLLYGSLATALVAGSAMRGAMVTLSFGVGAIPALVLAQAQSRWLDRLPNLALFFVRRGLPLLSAAVLVWRALHADPDDCCRH